MKTFIPPILIPIDSSQQSMPSSDAFAMLITVNILIIFYWIIKSIIFFIKKGNVENDFGKPITYIEYVFLVDDNYFSIGNAVANGFFLLFNGVAIFTILVNYINTFIK